MTETTDWCSPAFFLAKADGVRVRLVTDYTKLNKYVKRPVHPFPATRDIIQSVPKGQRVFAKLDAVHGYFQLALDEESSFLTTFLLPQGKFRYLRAPMGLNASSDGEENAHQHDGRLKTIQDSNCKTSAAEI